MLAIFNAYSRILQWFEASWSSLFAQFCVVMYCCVLMNLFMFSASAHFMDPAGSTWFVQILIRILGPKVSSILLCDFFSSFPQQVATSLAVPHSTMVAFLNSSVFHGTSVPCKYHMITWWYKMPGKISSCQLDFISEGGKPGCLVQGAAVMVWSGSSPFFHGSQSNRFYINISFMPDSWQREFCISLSVCFFFFSASRDQYKGA